MSWITRVWIWQVAGKTIEAAGGIVVRKGAGKLIAVVQRSKDDAWVLPRGKLKRDENPVVGARREVVEETGHRVEVHEYLGAITYRAGGRPKVVQFWRMEAEPEASHELMKDIVAVEWLPLKAAVRRLSYPLEKLFLRHAAARALKKRRAEAKAAKAKSANGKSAIRKAAKAKPAKTKLKKTKNVEAGKTKSKPVKVIQSAKKSVRKLAKPLLKQPKKSKAGKGKNSGKNKAGRKSGKPKKGKGKKAGREHPARTSSMAEARTEPKTSHATQPAAGRHASVSAVSPLPKRPGPQDTADARKTILQRMLGRLAG